MDEEEMTAYKALCIGIEEGMDQDDAIMFIAMGLLDDRLTAEESQSLRAKLAIRKEPQP